MENPFTAMVGDRDLTDICGVSSNFASADFRKIKTYNFQKS